MPVRARLLAAALAALAALPAAGCRRWSEPVQLGGSAKDDGPDPFDTALAQGELAFAERGEPARLQEALGAFSRAAALRPRDAGAQVWIARAEAFRALATQDPARAREAWLASARAAERALRRIAPAFAASVDRGDDPAAAAAGVTALGAEPLYLLAQGTMRSAQLTGYAAVLAVKDPCLAMMARAAELDERVDAAGPHRALGAWRAGLPIAAGGGATAARAHFDRARALHPTDLLARVAEAETLAVLLQDAARFDALLAEVEAFALEQDPPRAPENRIAKRLAAELGTRRPRLF
ncbi:MAG TPA: TRAP transporter TatT component family protein [Anaeromyxobacter sp.]|nr:TRAP transporter TatT component family protein [Anaeromyxobacter sp.]